MNTPMRSYWRFYWRSCWQQAGTAMMITAMTALLLGLAPPAEAGKDDPKAREIMQRVNDRDDGDNQTSDLEMILIDRKKNKRVRKIRSFNKDKGKDTLALSFFLDYRRHL